MTNPEEVGPLGQMMLANSELIEAAIDTYGPSAVAEFFITTGTSMAALYDLVILPDGKVGPSPETEAGN